MKKISFGTWALAFGPYVSSPVPFPKVVERLAELGFDAVEICGKSPHVSLESCATEEARADVKQDIKNAGLEVSGLTADMAGINPTDESKRESYLERFARYVDLAQALGAPGIRVDSVVRKAKGDDALGCATETFRSAAEKAAEANIQVCWEFEPCFAFNSPPEIIEMVEKVGHANFGVLYDTSHALMATQQGEGGAADLLDQLSGKIKGVHLADCDGTKVGGTSAHLPLGTGRVDLPMLAPKLAQLPVDYWTIDMCFWPAAWRLMPAQLAYAKRLGSASS